MADLPPCLCAALRAAGSDPAEVVAVQPVGGGCISTAEVVRMRDGTGVFVKRADAPAGRHRVQGLFAAEADGLAAIRAATVDTTIRVPRVLAVGWAVGSDPVDLADGAEDTAAVLSPARSEFATSDRAHAVTGEFLVLEYVGDASDATAGSASVPRRPTAQYWRSFGRSLAQMHEAACAEPGYGWRRDNFIGSTPQSNGAMTAWVAFFREHRLAAQLKMATDRGLADCALRNGLERICDRLDVWLAEPGQPSLVHGDLWAGNHLIDAAGRPVLIDPAVYRGHWEVDLAMSELFGGFDSAWYAGYAEVRPLPRGYRGGGDDPGRRDLYNLYHLLNHLIIFGAGYRASVMDVVNTYVRSI